MLQADTLEPLVLNLKPAHQRSACGVDTFDCSPPDKSGHVCVHVVVNHFTNFVFLYPAKDRSAKTMAAALFKFFISYGSVDEIVSDPGSNLTASLTEELFRLFGTRHRFSMVGVHTASGVEGTNALVLRYLRCICSDKIFRDRWGDDAVIGLVQYIINDGRCTETGIRRFDNQFGSIDGTYMQLPEHLVESSKSAEFLRLLDQDLQRLRALSAETHRKIIAERESAVTVETQNVFLSGELILVQRDPEVFQPAKLLAPFRGPYEVIHQERNRVECRHLATHHIREVPVERVKIFHGTREQAVVSANQDEDQTVIQAVTGWRGEPLLRTTISLRILFADGDIVWLPLTKDLDAAVPVGDYFLKTRPLRHIAFQPVAIGLVWVREKRKERLTDYATGDTIYVDLRSYGHRWYDERLVALERRFDIIYVLEYTVLAVFASLCVAPD